MGSDRSSSTTTPLPDCQLSQPDTRSPPAATFTYFPCLPPELRNRIWHYSLPGPRLIHLTTPSTPSHPQWGRFPFSKSACFPSCAPISMLSICRESRAIALPLYTFVTYLHPRYIVPFAPDQDVVMMDLDALKAFMRFRFWKNGRDEGYTQRRGRGVRRLALRCGDERIFGNNSEKERFYYLISQTLGYFGHLEEVILCWLGERKDGGERRNGRELELEKHLMTERHRQRRLGYGGMPGVNYGNKPVLRIPRIVSLSAGASEGDEVLEETILGVERLDKKEVTCAKYWHCHGLVELGQRCENLKQKWVNNGMFSGQGQRELYPQMI